MLFDDPPDELPDEPLDDDFPDDPEPEEPLDELPEEFEELLEPKVQATTLLPRAMPPPEELPEELLEDELLELPPEDLLPELPEDLLPELEELAKPVTLPFFILKKGIFLVFLIFAAKPVGKPEGKLLIGLFNKLFCSVVSASGV